MSRTLRSTAIFFYGFVTRSDIITNNCVKNAFHREGMALVTQKRIESLRQSHLGQVKGNLEV